MQATRGTAIADLSGASGAAASLRRRPARVLLVASFVVVYAIDQLTKLLVVHHLADGAVRPLLGDLLQLHLTRNSGAAFSTGTGYTAVLACLAIVAVAVVAWFGRWVATPGWAIAFGLLLAGIGGNLSDRLLRAPGPLRGQVIDFLQLPHWPIFNVADMSINVAAAVVLVQVFRGVRLDGTRTEDDPVVDDREP